MVIVEQPGQVIEELDPGESILVETDADIDGIPNNDDKCPDSPPGEVVDADGCSINQLCLCSGPWKNHSPNGGLGSLILSYC